MKPEPQKAVLELLRTGRPIRSREFIRECEGWDFRKSICRLKKQGFDIKNISSTGEGVYQLIPKQERLF